MAKKTKAIKFSDIRAEKPWLRRKGENRKQIETVEQYKTILIVCEGQSEELYFKSFPVVSCTVSAICLGQSKESLVDSTLDLMARESYDEVWCVFDMDLSAGAKELASFDNAITRAYRNNISVAYSNDSFELWFYLHYEYLEQQNRRNFYFDFLSKKWDLNYSNEGKKHDFCNNIYKLLKTSGNQEKAIQRAEKLHKSLEHLTFSKQNPVTLVYQLVKVLNENIRS